MLGPGFRVVGQRVQYQGQEMTCSSVWQDEWSLPIEVTLVDAAGNTHTVPWSQVKRKEVWWVEDDPNECRTCGRPLEDGIGCCDYEGEE